MQLISRILGAKYRLFDNHIRSIRRHVFIHLVVGLGILLFVWGGGLALFEWLFGFLADQEPFGRPLINRLMGMVLIAFFSMLIFSNLIVTLSTTYVSREVEYFMTLPLSMSTIFWAKFIESTLYSSWAFVIMSLPVFVAYGNALNAGLMFIPALGLMLAPFVIIPATIGSIVTMLVSAFVPARRARILALILGGVSIAIVVILLRFMGGQTLDRSASQEDFSRIMAMLTFGSRPWLPNVWLTRGMMAAAERDWSEYGYWLLMLVSTALMAGQVCAWLVRPLYYRGWALARESQASGRGGRREGLFVVMDFLYRPFAHHIRALMSKDTRVFWRDPVQWSQLLILFGLLVIYIANVRSMLPADEMGTILGSPLWKARISLFNMGATCFILSILSTRFMYPLLSLEGKQAWIVTMGPMKRTALVWQKYWLCWITAFVLTQAIAIFSAVALQVERDIFIISIATIFFLSFGLTSLAVGLGALTPNFREDNPARIANGMGGTVNVILSLLYIAVILGLQGWLYIVYRAGGHYQIEHLRWYTVGAVAALVVVHSVIIVLPMWLGLRNWERIEF